MIESAKEGHKYFMMGGGGIWGGGGSIQRHHLHIYREILRARAVGETPSNKTAHARHPAAAPIAAAPEPLSCRRCCSNPPS
jgi:hypothetical protein